MFPPAAAALLVVIGTVAANAQAPVKLSLQTGVMLSWPTSTNDTYQPQWSPNSGVTWNTLGSVLPGGGTTNALYDPVPGGARSYQVLQMVPGTPPTPATIVNGGFESGSGIIASNWTVTTAAGGTVYGERTNDNPHSGSYNFEVCLTSTGAGPVLAFSQANLPVTGGTTYPFTFYADALAGSAGYNTQWQIQWNTGGGTGFQACTPGNNIYALISNSVAAPARSNLGDHQFL